MRTPHVGDLIQWESGGVFMFSSPLPIVAISKCHNFVFIEGSQTGIPADQVKFEEDERFTLFYNRTIYSQWHMLDMVVEDRVYNCCEQFMMHQKALIFGDHETAKKIMAAAHASEQKALGKIVRNFDKTHWNSVARDVVYLGNSAKFSQHPDLKKSLLATKGTTLVEGSPTDRIWGVGLAKTDRRILDRKTWRGTNWLGEVLTRLRDDFLSVKNFGAT